MNQDRRSILASIALILPFGLTGRTQAAEVGLTPILHFRTFEESLREAFGARPANDEVPGEAFRICQIEVGHSDDITAGLQGCHNDRTFAGFPCGHLRIIRTGSAPGPVFQGVRLYVATVDVALTLGALAGTSCPLDFATVPPAPVFACGNLPRSRSARDLIIGDRSSRRAGVLDLSLRRRKDSEKLS